jgi:peroxiredoxin
LWDLQRYQAEIVPARLKVLVIIRDQPEAVATFLKNDRHSLTCTIMTDPDGSACQSAGVGGHTLIFLTDRNQVVRRLLHFTDRREKFTPAQWVDDLLDSSEL